jgi:Holliday junction DNA helicase RuvA
VIDSITGRVVRVGGDHIVLETGGVAFHILTPPRDAAHFHLGEDGLAYVDLIVREDALFLCGFPRIEEREAFRLLQSVTGVGPRLALQILSTFTPQELVAALGAGDVDTLVRVKGIGRKTAQRILIELRDKVTGDLAGARELLPLSAVEEAAVRALTSKTLGFSAREAQRAVERLRGETLPLEDLVRRALEVIHSA